MLVERDYEVIESREGQRIKPAKNLTFTFFHSDFAWVAYDLEFMFRLCCMTNFDFEGRPLSWPEVKYCLPKG